MNATAPIRQSGGFTRATVAFFGFGLLGAFMLLFRYDPAGQPFYPLCVFHLATGLNCPGCGALRSLHQLFHGQLVAALRCNAPLILSLPPLAFFSARAFARRLAGRPWPRPVVRPAWIVVLVGVLLLFGILRNLPFPPFIYLSPP